MLHREPTMFPELNNFSNDRFQSCKFPTRHLIADVLIGKLIRLSIPSRRLLLSKLNRNQPTVISPKYDSTRSDIFEAVVSMKTSFFLYTNSLSGRFSFPVYLQADFSLYSINPFSIRSGISTASHGPSPRAMACAIPNLGTFLPQRGLK